MVIALLFLLFALVVAVVVFCIRSPRCRLQAVQNVRQLHRMLSVQLAVLAGFLGSLIPVAEQIQQALPQLAGVQQLHALTSSAGYQTFVALLTLFIPVARAISQTKRPEQQP